MDEDWLALIVVLSMGAGYLCGLALMGAGIRVREWWIERREVERG